jgi:hypothetical protein
MVTSLVAMLADLKVALLVVCLAQRKAAMKEEMTVDH